jgi:hypothetical protein
MDFSENYINMCTRARELQLAHSIYEAGDFYFEGLDPITQIPRFSVATESQHGKERTIASLKSFWLPRQDQLQAMAGEYLAQCKLMYPHLMKVSLMDSINCSPDWIDSMEQLWLSLIMKEKYDKVWKNTDWVKTLSG